jgi:hypothetical protein
VSVLLRQPHGFEGLLAAGMLAEPDDLALADREDVVDALLDLYAASGDSAFTRMSRSSWNFATAVPV